MSPTLTTARLMRLPGLPALAAILTLACTAMVAAQTGPPKPDVKRWVLEQLSKGEEANLDSPEAQKLFPQPSDRVVDAAFITALATNDAKSLSAHLGGFTMHRHGVRIYGVTVSGKLDLRSGEVPHVFKLSKCVFEDEVDFSQAALQKVLVLSESTFKKSFNLSFAEVKNTFDATKARFNATNFDSLKVGGNAAFTEAEFHGPANFINLQVSWNLQGDRAKFFWRRDPAQPEASINFSLIRVAGSAFLRAAAFDGPVRFRSASVAGTLNVEGTRFSDPSLSADFTNLKVGQLSLSNAIFASPPNFTGLDYEHLSPKTGDVLSREFDAAGRAHKFEDGMTDAYNDLYSFYKQRGESGEAADVYVEWKRGERRADWHAGRYADYAWSLVQDLTTGYGQRLELALLWSGVFIAIGFFVFRKEEGMEAKDPDHAKRCSGRYHPGWYSIALFLPVISLEDAEIWRPKLDRRAARFYMRLHEILGYLLIPIGLAAWTGIID